MSCEELREQLPDYILGTLSEPERVAVRRHLRGCSGCRAEATMLDEGVAMFSSAAHEVPPPSELKDRVMTVLADEWREAPVPRHPRIRAFVGWPAVAAAVLILAGALSWGAVSQTRVRGLSEDAASYRSFLHALGGKAVRVGLIHPIASSLLPIDGTTVMYDSDRGDSWVLVLVRAPGYSGELKATISAIDGRSIVLHPLQIDPRGDGATWLVTSANISGFNTVRVSVPNGRVVATGTARSEEH